MDKSSKIFKATGWTLVTMIAGFFIFPYLLHEGMFFDGMTYSAVGRNLYLGHGTFWKPYYNEIDKPFYSHLPVAFGMLSQFYKIFGDNLYSPKIYNLFVVIVVAITIRSLWIKLDKDNKFIDWWPFIFLLVSPTVFNTIRNTMLENTVLMFILIAIRFMWSAMESFKYRFLYLFLGAVFIFLAFLTKGVVALFPFAFPFIYSLFHKGTTKRAIGYSFLLAGFFTVFLGLIVLLIPASRPYFYYYFNHTVGHAVAGQDAITEYKHFFIPIQLALETLPFLILSIPLFIFYKKRSIKINYNIIFLLLLIGLSASLPLMISPKQRSYYLLPALPFYIMAFSMFMQPLILLWVSRVKKNKLFIVLPVFFIVVSIVYPLVYDTYPEYHHHLVGDCKKLDAQFPDKTILSAHPGLAYNYKVVAFMARIGVLTMSPDLPSDYLLTMKNEAVDSAHLEKLELGLVQFELYKKKK